MKTREIRLHEVTVSFLVEESEALRVIARRRRDTLGLGASVFTEPMPARPLPVFAGIVFDALKGPATGCMEVEDFKVEIDGEDMG